MLRVMLGQRRGCRDDVACPREVFQVPINGAAAVLREHALLEQNEVLRHFVENSVVMAAVDVDLLRIFAEGDADDFAECFCFLCVHGRCGFLSSAPAPEWRGHE
ncbi:hypothetical protein [Paraburkholderia phenoliruptrix]|uniref:hypothetical protein n=1 Tax=Paraburkholderia phenoliruptrix TaxID=252970 RepID=UPI0034CF88C3